MEDTIELWKHFEKGEFDVYISETTLREVDACFEPRRTELRRYLSDIIYTELSITDEVKHLADRIIELRILPPKSRNDSLHIAVAVVNSCNYVLSWNFKHMVRPKTNLGIRAIAEIEGYKKIFILSPSSFIGEMSL